MADEEWMHLRSELTETTSALSQLIRRQQPSRSRVADLDWTVDQLAAHLVTIPTRYLRVIETSEPFPVSLAEMNQREIDALGVEDLDLLADLLQSQTDALLDALGDDPDRLVPFFEIELPVRGLCGVLLGEYVVHGLDLADHVRTEWRVRPEHARWAIRGLLPGAMHTADTDIASAMRGTFGLHIRPEDDWTITVGDGRAELALGRPTRADFRVSADPLAFYLTGFGRASRIAAMLRGKIVGYGRKPWLAGRFSRLFHET